MSNWGTLDGSRACARPGRGLRLPSFPPHKVYPEAGSMAILSGWVHVPLSRHVIAEPLDGFNERKLKGNIK